MKRAAWLMLALMLLPVTGVCAAEDAQARRVEELARAALAPTEEELRILKTQSRFVVDGGVWSQYRFTDFDEDDNDENLRDATAYTQSVDYRVWLRGTLRPSVDHPEGREHSFYLRVKDKYFWRHPQGTSGGDDHDGPHVDYAYLTLNFQPVLINAGRRYFSVGQGIAYSDVHDGAEVSWSSTNWTLTGLAAHTLPHQDNLDLSVPGSNKSSRTFWGAQVNYIGVKNHGLYAYTVFQRDRSEENPIDHRQDYAYDSAYYGLGSEGSLLPRVHYWAEVIGETGRSVVTGGTDRNTVRAMAVDLGCTYDMPLPTTPALYGEYAYGSGDDDRGHAVNTVAGNADGDDTNFNYFGYLPTGYALSPRLSNIHMFKLGTSVKPLMMFAPFRNLSLSADWYRFFKDEPLGAIFDPEGAGNDRDVGYEVDLTVQWQMLSDLACAVEYGHFEPGDAYDDATNDAAEYFSVSMTLTF